MEFSVEVDDHAGLWAVLKVSGELDLYTAPCLRQELAQLVNQGRHQVVVDLGGVEFLDSMGLGVLVGALKGARSHGGDLRLVCNRQRILKVFEITGLMTFFSIFSSTDKATSPQAWLAPARPSRSRHRKGRSFGT